MIQLSNVNFKYNNSSRGALYDISLDIHKGDVYCFVVIPLR